MVSHPRDRQGTRMEQTEAREAGSVTENQDTSKMEFSKSTDSGEDGGKPSQPETEEKSFVANLYHFMKDRNTPIERIPHLGFKQINLWRIYKAVEKLGGYDSVTARRLWKNVYDELGGSPGSTSAATCTRRHYERLVLPFERQLRGEEDKPLPSAKPRKQYRRSPDGQGSKAEGKRKRSLLGKEGHVTIQVQEKTEDPHTALWTKSARGPETDVITVEDTATGAGPVSQPSRSLFLSVPSSGSEVISPLEKKKRLAQASLELSQVCPETDSPGRPSVIHCAQSPGIPLAGRTCEGSSEGSPVPRSSSSSRSPSPCSVSSDDCLPLVEDGVPTVSGTKRRAPTERLEGFAVVPYPGVEDLASYRRHHLLQVDLAGRKVLKLDLDRSPDRQSPLKSHQPVATSSWGPTSSFTKVLPKAGGLMQPVYKPQQNLKRPLPEDVTTYGKKMQMVPPLHQGEPKEKFKPGLPKPSPTHPSLFHPHANVPVSYFLPSYEKMRPGVGHPVPPLLVPAHMSQPGFLYRHVAARTPYSVPYHPLPRPCPYPHTVWHPQVGYTLAGLHPQYPNTKL